MHLECKAFVKHGWWVEIAKLEESKRKKEEKEGRKEGRKRKIKRKRERGSRLFMDLFVAT